MISETSLSPSQKSFAIVGIVLGVILLLCKLIRALRARDQLPTSTPPLPPNIELPGLNREMINAFLFLRVHVFCIHILQYGLFINKEWIDKCFELFTKCFEFELFSLLDKHNKVCYLVLLSNNKHISKVQELTVHKQTGPVTQLFTILAYIKMSNQSMRY